MSDVQRMLRKSIVDNHPGGTHKLEELSTQVPIRPIWLILVCWRVPCFLLAADGCPQLTIGRGGALILRRPQVHYDTGRIVVWCCEYPH